VTSDTHNAGNTSWWPSASEIGSGVVAEAECDAKRLGHKLVGWVSKDGKFYSRCCDCLEAIVVAPRHLGVARIRGAAASLRCVKKRGQQRR
jgi:hypothetical protein